MKLKITITGPKVHDVGYRPWLTEQAMNTALRGFEVYNDEVAGQQAVIALAEADEPRIKRFLNTVKTMQPQLAEMSGVASEEYTEDIMPVWQAAAMSTATQMNKAIPILLKIAENTDLIPQIVKNTDLIPQIAKNTDQIPQIAKNTDLIPQMIKATERTANAADKILEEVKGLKEEIRPGLSVQLSQLQADNEGR